MLNPLKRVSSEDAGDDDLAGPLLFGVLMGSLHLMRGRVHFGYILGWTTLATLAMYWLLNQLGAHGEGIELYRCGSIIGYCMLPMCLLAALAPFLPGGFVTAVVAGVLVLWCAGKATMQFMRSLPHSEGKRLVVAYPCASSSTPSTRSSPCTDASVERIRLARREIPNARRSRVSNRILRITRTRRSPRVSSALRSPRSRAFVSSRRLSSTLVRLTFRVS